jgi:LacI family sucrose operon transcriptional repressor
LRKSINQIARLAGVSKTTVSLIINNKADRHRISMDTQKRVRRIIERVDFSPNQYARGFRQKKSGTIGFVIGDITNRFFSLLAKSLENRAREKGYTMIIANTGDNVKNETRVVKSLLSRSVDGLIITSAQKTDTLWKILRDYETPGVYIDRRVSRSRLPCVTSDNMGGAYDLTSRFIKKGIKDIGFIGGIPHISTHHDRFEGFKKALRTHGLPLKSRLTTNRGFTTEAGYESAERLFSGLTTAPQALFTASFTLLEGLLSYLKDNYRGVPWNMKLFTFDDHPLLDYMPVPITSMRQDWDKMADAGFSVLMDSMEGKKIKKNTIIKPSLIIRN